MVTAMAWIGPKEIVLGFHGCINDRDVPGLKVLMTEDHRFIDAADRVIEGRAACLDAWSRFFEAFPDYRNQVEVVTTVADVVTMTGRSLCSDARLEGPALWTARIENGQIAEWRVYVDTMAIRSRLGLD